MLFQIWMETLLFSNSCLITVTRSQLQNWVSLPPFEGYQISRNADLLAVEVCSAKAAARMSSASPRLRSDFKACFCK